MKLDYETLIDIVEQNLIMEEIEDEKDFYLIRHLNNIVFEEGIKTLPFKYNNRMPLKKSINLVLEFFNQLNPKYAEHFKRCLDENVIDFDFESKKDIGGYSDIDSETKKSYIYLSCDNTLSDSFGIVHEVMHDINIERDGNNETRGFYTESLSILSEFLYEDFLIKKGIKDAKIVNNWNLYYLGLKSLDVDFNLALIEKYLQNGYLNEYIIREIMNDYHPFFHNQLNEIVDEINTTGILTMNRQQTYIIGLLIATYMYSRIKENKKNIQELFELNELIKEVSFSDVLDYLDLEYEEYDLKPKTYQKLKTDYKNYLKSR